MSTIDMNYNSSDEELCEEYNSDDGNLSEEFGLYHEQRKTDEDILSFSNKDIVNERGNVLLELFLRKVATMRTRLESAPTLILLPANVNRLLLILLVLGPH